MWSKSLEVLNPYEALMEKQKNQPHNISNRLNIIDYFKNLFKKVK